MKRILIIGGYGNFGSHAAKKLLIDPNIILIICGRNGEKAQKFASELGGKTEHAVVDMTQNFAASLAVIKPDIVLHTSGPFQDQGYGVAKACIEFGCHYIDLADARDFVRDIVTLDAAAKEKGVMVISGASSVPTLSTAVIEHYLPHFKKITSVDFGIATAQKTNRGLATTSAVLSYTGKSFTTLQNGVMKTVYGWQDLRAHKYPDKHSGHKWRLLCNCDIPDLDLLPKRYPDLENVRFQAGLELPLLHVGVWMLSFLVRWHLLPRLDRFAKPLLYLSDLLNVAGSDDSAFHLMLEGLGHDGRLQSKTFYLTARHGDGLYIPVAPAIICARKLASGALSGAGAYPCTGFVTLDEYRAALDGLDVTISD